MIRNDRYGYLNSAGKAVIPIQFSDADNFTQSGLAPVQQKNKWGFINLQGEMVIPAQFSNVLCFGNNGWAVVKQKRKWGYIAYSFNFDSF